MSFEVQKQGLGKVATLVIPLRLGPHLFQGQTRLELILDRVPGQLFEIIIVDYGSSPRYRKHLLIAARRHRARVIRPRECSAQFSIARARNVGAMHAKTSVVVFHDVDFLGQHGDYQALANLIEARQVATRLSGFFIVPISFLTKGGSKRFLDRTSNKPVNISAQFLESITDYVAWNSSCLVIGRLFFLGLGGNDEEFDGHGAEDFEFYHRLNSTLNSVEHKE